MRFDDKQHYTMMVRIYSRIGEDYMRGFLLGILLRYCNEFEFSAIRNESEFLANQWKDRHAMPARFCESLGSLKR